MRFLVSVLLSVSVLSAPAQDPPAENLPDPTLFGPDSSAELGAPLAPAELIDFPFGMDARWRTLTAKLSPDAFDPDPEKLSVLVISRSMPELFDGGRFSISWAPAPAPSASFPPGFKSAYIAGQQYLWRWIEMLGPDVVVTDHPSLRAALSNRLTCVGSLDEIPETITPSLLSAELAERGARSPVEIAEAVGAHYGHELKSIGYIPALSMIGRARLAGLNGEDLRDGLTEIAEAAPVAKNISGPTAAGHLVFAELDLKDRVITAAQGASKNPGDNEMSDSVFMICPLLASAGRMAGDESFFQACLDHLEKMQSLCLREDGLYRHSPLDESAWGRGNGFPAMGLAWVLSEMPESFPGRQKVLDDFRDHIAALTEFQDASGMWHQVIDHPESYREFTSTCMITFAILRGLREGWLDKAEYGDVADRGWEAVKRRISLDGESFTDACTSTGKQKSLKDYFRRTAIIGPDARSGAMALLVATERAWWERGGGEPDVPAPADLDLEALDPASLEVPGAE
jgi:hypothetical protein